MEVNLKEINYVLEEHRDDTERKYLTFWSDKQLFGIPILNVVQIVGMQDITPVPNYPEYARGVINMRGKVIPVIDFRMRLGSGLQSYNDRTCIIVVNMPRESEYLGYIVDGVEEVAEISEEHIVKPPHLDGKLKSTYVAGIARQEWGDAGKERMILCIDPDKVIEKEEKEEIYKF